MSAPTGERTADAKPSYTGWAGLKRAFAQPAARWVGLQGFSSGLPFLLVGPTLSTWMADEKLDLAVIGLFSFVSSFYVLKFLWSPFLDLYAPPFLGRRRGWMALSQMGVIVGLIAMALIGVKADPLVLTIIIAVTAFAAATQDVVIDAYRIEIAPVSDQAAMSAAATFGYRIGLYMAGAIALYIAEFANWRAAYLTMATLMLLPLWATWLAPEPVAAEGQLLPAESRNPTGAAIAEAFVRPLSDFFQSHGTVLALLLLLFVGCFKLPDQMIGPMSGAFYLAQGFTKADIATVSKIFGVVMGIVGAFLGGAGVVFLGLRRMLLIAAITVALSNFAYLLMANFPSQRWSFYAAILADNTSQGLAGTVLVAFIASMINAKHTATQFALMVSLANLPGRFIGGVSGYIVKNTSYEYFYILSTVSVLPTLLLLAWLWPRIEDGKSRRAEQAR